MSAQEFKVGQSIGGTDYDRLPVGAKFRRGPQYSEYEVTETGFKLGMADTTLTAADYRSARRITHLPGAAEPEDKDDLYVEPEPLKEGDWCLIWAQFDTVEPDDDGDVTVDVPGSGLGTQYVRSDAIVRPDAGQVPPWVKPARCTSLWELEGDEDEVPMLSRCSQSIEGHGQQHYDDAGYSWTDDEAYGRVEVSS